MLPLLLDTVIFSLFLKPNDSRARLYLPDLEGKLLALSFVSIGELYRWAYQHHWGNARIEELRRRMSKVVTLPFHETVAQEWARIQATDRPLGDNDAWIAACAISYGCTLVSDDRGFQRVRGLSLISRPSI